MAGSRAAPAGPSDLPLRGSGGELSHLLVHQDTPPPQLLGPLPGGQGELLKGICPAAEAQIAASLKQRTLHQRPLRIAVGEVEGIAAALVKFQAGDLCTGQFQIEDVESDAIAALDSAFSLDIAIEHVDVWSVVPGPINEEGQIHWPVFAVSASREAYAAATAAGRVGRELLGALGVVRYDPLLIQYAPANCGWTTNLHQMPRSAYTMAALGSDEDWEQLVAEATRFDYATADDADRVRVVLRGNQHRRCVAITIDDGPCPLITPLILRVLDKEAVKATFFVVGEKAEQYPELLREIVRGGHLVGNHTYHHRRLSEIAPEQIVAEIEACQKAVGRLTGKVTRYLRPPGGNYSQAVLEYLTGSPYTIVLWTHSAGDWGNPPVSGIVQRCLKNVRPGSIILMHGGDINSVRALPHIIRGLRYRHLEPVTLPEMLGPDDTYQMTIAQALALPQNGWQPEAVK